MAKVPKGKEFEKAPEGNHPSVCILVCDLGTQEKEYEGKKYDSRQIKIGMQLVDERTTEGENMCIYADYTFSDKSKNLAKVIKAWTGEVLDDCDPATLLMRPALTNVTRTESKDGKKTYANISAITQPPKGVKVTKATEPALSFFFEFQYDEDEQPIPESVTFDEEDFKALPDWLKKRIVQSQEYPIALANNENGGWEGAKKGKGKAAKAATKTPVKTGRKK
jgi:hypothetical protein